MRCGVELSPPPLNSLLTKGIDSSMDQYVKELEDTLVNIQTRLERANLKSKTMEDFCLAVNVFDDISKVLSKSPNAKIREVISKRSVTVRFRENHG